MPAQSGTVVAVNLAVVRTDEFTRVKSGRSGIDKRPVDHPVLLDVLGVEGDTICDTANHGGADQAVYAYSTVDLAFWAAELGQEFTPGGVGENLTLDGIDCSGAVVGERWRIGDAEEGPILQVRGPRIPCRVFAGFRQTPDLVKRFLAAGRPGSYLAVDRPGYVRAGDSVTVLDVPEHGTTVADVMAAYAGDRTRLEKLTAARDHLSAEKREWFDRIVARLSA
ncbi:MOSC domain-containing protein [Pseudonocardia sp. CA-107938]|uniref:MOSC domain-containing protein n=1 Tax=Pseudonocardia sp. CA-107938 TaxID=3240021 RepID=UPI003D8E9399